MFPQLKKRVVGFLVGEEGKISKQSLLTLGAFLGSGFLGSILLSKSVGAQTYHTNDLSSLEYSGDVVSATHGHHSSHSSGAIACSGACAGACGACAGPCGACGACACGGPCGGACGF